MEGPINRQSYHNTKTGCNTCGKKWQSLKELDGSNCNFCGISSCKDCMTKQRNFAQKAGAERQVNKSGRLVVARGKICKLCDRKFLIKDMI